MHLEIVHEHQGKNRVRNHGGDLKENLIIDPEISRDPVNDIRIAREDQTQKIMMMIGGDIGNQKVELKRKMNTKIEGLEKDTQTSTTTGPLQNDLLPQLRNFLTENRSAYLIMINRLIMNLKHRIEMSDPHRSHTKMTSNHLMEGNGHLRFPTTRNLNHLMEQSDHPQFPRKKNSNHLLEVEKNSIVMSHRQQPAIRCSQMMTCGMMMPRRIQKNRHQRRYPTTFLHPHHLQRRLRHLRLRHRLLENPIIPHHIQRTTKRALSLPISHLLHQ